MRSLDQAATKLAQRDCCYGHFAQPHGHCDVYLHCNVADTCDLHWTSSILVFCVEGRMSPRSLPCCGGIDSRRSSLSFKSRARSLTHRRGERELEGRKPELNELPPMTSSLACDHQPTATPPCFLLPQGTIERNICTADRDCGVKSLSIVTAALFGKRGNG